MTYEYAFAELQRIVEAVQSEQIGIDELATYTQRANELIDFCRERLRKVEASLEQDDLKN